MPSKTPIKIEKRICKLYLNGFGTCELAKKFNLNRWTILEILKRNNFSPQRITRPYKNKFNIKFFETYSLESCYWGGFIYADGNIHNKKKILQISLSNLDEDHLFKFKKCIKSNAPLYDDNKNAAKKFVVSGSWYAHDLLKNFNIKSNKTFTIEFPMQIPTKYYSSFIRGIFDGDGSIIINKAGTLVINLTGNVKTISKIRDIFLDYLKITDTNFAKIQINKKNSNICSFALSSNKAYKILSWLYYDSNNQTRLTRKYKKFLQIKSKYEI